MKHKVLLLGLNTSSLKKNIKKTLKKASVFKQFIVNNLVTETFQDILLCVVFKRLAKLCFDKVSYLF